MNTTQQPQQAEERFHKWFLFAALIFGFNVLRSLFLGDSADIGFIFKVLITSVPGAFLLWALAHRQNWARRLNIILPLIGIMALPSLLTSQPRSNQPTFDFWGNKATELASAAFYIAFGFRLLRKDFRELFITSPPSRYTRPLLILCALLALFTGLNFHRGDDGRTAGRWFLAKTDKQAKDRIVRYRRDVEQAAGFKLPEWGTVDSFLDRNNIQAIEFGESTTPAARRKIWLFATPIDQKMSLQQTLATLHQPGNSANKLLQALTFSMLGSDRSHWKELTPDEISELPIKMESRTLLCRVVRFPEKPNDNEGIIAEWRGATKLFTVIALAGDFHDVKNFLSAIILHNPNYRIGEEELRLMLGKAQSGDKKAAYELGKLLWAGNGVEQDDAKALLWFRQAASQGDAQSEFNISQILHASTVVQRDETQAVKLLEKAAYSNLPIAQFYLGHAYAAADPAKSYYWMGLAHMNGMSEAKSWQEKLRSRLNAEQVSQAEKEIGMWKFIPKAQR